MTLPINFSPTGGGIPFTPGGPPSSAAANKFMATHASPTVEIVLIGANVIAGHQQVVPLATISGAAQILTVMGIHMVSRARMNLATNRNQAGLPNIRTGQLHDSIRASENGTPAEVFFNGMDMWVDVHAGGHTILGETIDDARAWFLEFGFMHQTAGFVQYPYMTPALVVTGALFERAILGLITIPNGFATTGVPTADAAINRYRSFFYTTSKALGDIQVFYGNPFIGKLRSASLMAARGLGDLDSVMKGSLSARIESRVVGRWSSGGFAGSKAVTMSGPPGSFGAMGGRIYNRFAGKGMGAGLRELSIGRL